MSDENVKGKMQENSDAVQSELRKKYNIPKIELTTTSFDNYTLNKLTEESNNETKKESDISKLKNLFIDPKLEANVKTGEKSNSFKSKRNSIFRIPDKNNNVTKSFDYLSIDTKTNHFQSNTIPLKSPDSQTPLKSGNMSKSQPNLIKDMNESVKLQDHISKMFNHAFTDAVYSPRESWLATVFNIYHAIILYLSLFLECYSTQLMTQDTEFERKAWRIVSLIFTIQLCLYFLADVILYPIRKRRHLAMLEATTSNNLNNKGEIISYKEVKVTRNLFKLYKGFIDFPHTMEFLGCLPFFIEEIFPQCRIINLNHYGLISFILMCCRLYTCLSIFYYLRNRISKFFHIIIRAIKESIYEIISVIVLYFIVMIFCSRVIFYADLSKCTLDEASQNWKRQYKNGTINENSLSCELQSNLDAFWYTFMTMTTLGFGDQTPDTYFGKIMATVAFGATPILYSLPSIVITTKMITLIIHDTRSTATKDVAKKHKRRFFNMGLFLSGAGVNKRNKFSRLSKKTSNNNNIKKNDKESKSNFNQNNKNRFRKNKRIKGKDKSKENNNNNSNDKSKEKYTIPLSDENSGSNSNNNKKKKLLLSVPGNKKEESSFASSISPLISNGNQVSSFDTKDSKDFSFSNSNSNSNSYNNSNSNSNSPKNSNDNNNLSEDGQEDIDKHNMISNPRQLYESPELKNEGEYDSESKKEVNQPVMYESPKEIGESELQKAIINQKKDILASSNLSSSMTIKKLYKDNPSSVGKPLASIFENPESGQLYSQNDISHPPTSPSASTSYVNINNSNPNMSKNRSHPKTTFKSLPISAGSGSNSETENESTIFDYNAYKKNANNKNYIVGMLKQHYQTCLDEIDYVKKREKTLNSLKSGFEKGIMALQT
eukprot:jgi/Orpsp1_1/1186418/evm.model.d7180000050444.1